MPLSPYWFRFPFSWCYMVLFSWSATIGWNEHPFMWSVTGFCPSVPTSPPVCGPNMQMFAIDKVYPSLWKNKRWFTFSPQLWYFASSEMNRWCFFGKEKMPVLNRYALVSRWSSCSMQWSYCGPSHGSRAACSSQVHFPARQSEARGGLIVAPRPRKRNDLWGVWVFFIRTTAKAGAAERVVGCRGHFPVQEITVVVAHVPVPVPTAERSERISVCERIPDLLAPSAALIRAFISVFLSVAVILRVVVVIAGRGEGGQLGWFHASVWWWLHRHPAGVRVTKLITFSCALSCQSHVREMPGIWGTEKEAVLGCPVRELSLLKYV